MSGFNFIVQPAEWDRRFMRLAYEVRHWSKDPDEQVGAVLVSPDRREVGIGYNGLPWGFPDLPDTLCNKDLKNALTTHAELNALLNSRRDISGWTLYTTKAPCLQCCLAIRQARIARVVSAPIDEASRWADSQRSGVRMLSGLDVQVAHMVLDKLGG